MKCKISVIVPIYNRASTIGECLDSILSQTFHDFEVILVDNNSTDTLDKVLAEYSDPRIRLTRCSTPGASAARMHGVSLSNGKYLSFIDSDDIWRDDVLKKVFERMESSDRPVAVYLSLTMFREGEIIDWKNTPRSEILVTDNLLKALWLGAPGAGALAGVRHELFDDGRGFAKDLQVGEDVDWALRNAMRGPVHLLNDQPRLGYRRHENNITQDCELYSAWADELLKFAYSDRYSSSSNKDLKLFIVTHLIGQLQTIIKKKNYSSFLRIYPRVVILGFKWKVFAPLPMPTLFAAYFRKRRGSQG